MKFILGTKENMTEFFTEEGKAVPVTIVSAGPCVVTQVKTKEKDGYSAVQVGFGKRREKNINKAQKGHFKDLGSFRYVKEFRLEEDSSHKVGDKLQVGDIFEAGDIVRVSGTSKGKGFQGVVKRHGFAGGRRTHGQKHSEREAGSIGATGPARVFKGTKMAGRMGGDRVTEKNLKIVSVSKDSNIVFISGAVPGIRGGLIEVVKK